MKPRQPVSEIFVEDGANSDRRVLEDERARAILVPFLRSQKGQLILKQDTLTTWRMYEYHPE